MADIAGYDGQRTEFKVVGKPNLPGKLSYNLAAGKAKFGADATAPNMLHAKFLRSPYAYAVIKSMDISKAKALPGVVDIVTWEDPDIRLCGWRWHGSLPSRFSTTLPTRKTPKWGRRGRRKRKPLRRSPAADQGGLGGEASHRRSPRRHQTGCSRPTLAHPNAKATSCLPRRSMATLRPASSRRTRSIEFDFVLPVLCFAHSQSLRQHGLLV